MSSRTFTFYYCVGMRPALRTTADRREPGACREPTQSVFPHNEVTSMLAERAKRPSLFVTTLLLGLSFAAVRCSDDDDDDAGGGGTAGSGGATGGDGGNVTGGTSGKTGGAGGGSATGGASGAGGAGARAARAPRAVSAARAVPASRKCSIICTLVAATRSAVSNTIESRAHQGKWSSSTPLRRATRLPTSRSMPTKRSSTSLTPTKAESPLCRATPQPGSSAWRAPSPYPAMPNAIRERRRRST